MLNRSINIYQKHCLFASVSILMKLYLSYSAGFREIEGRLVSWTVRGLLKHNLVLKLNYSIFLPQEIKLRLARLSAFLVQLLLDMRFSGFEKLQDHIQAQGEQEAEIFDYFERTYIGVPFGRSRTRRDPPFSPSLWSCHYRVKDQLPKTNNSVEGWHHSLQSSLGFHHPDPYRLIAALKAEQSLTEQKQADARRGVAPRVSKTVYTRIAERLQAVLVNYVTTPLIDTLLACRFAYEM